MLPYIIAFVKKTRKRLRGIHDRMLEHYGEQKWWPAKTAFECVVGAILTQNTAWTNVEKAIGLIRRKTEITVEGIENTPEQALARLVRPSGYFNQKARRLKIFARFVTENYDGNINKLLSEKTEKLRKTLLEIEGIGPETADSIVLYAAGRPSFVVDAYTKRILSRHGLADEKAPYDSVRKLFMDNLPRKATIFNEYHALIVRTAKERCHKKKPDCAGCPLEADLKEAGIRLS